MHFYWGLATLAALPLFLVYFAFRRVLASKKVEIEMLLYRGETLTTYLAAYGGSNETKKGETETLQNQIEGIVGQVFRLHYPWSEYCFALVFSASATITLIGLAFALAGLPLGLPTELQTALLGNTPVRNTVAGGLGALVWSIYDLVERYQSRDLPANRFFAPGVRIIVVGAVGAMIGTAANDRLAAPLAFAIGALPLSVVLEYIGRRARKQLGIPEPKTIQTHPSFDSIQGWSADLAERLARSGVSSVQALACANQFELYLRSSLEWRIILDLSDQALLVLYIGDRIQHLRALGIRTAVELAELDWSEGESYFKGIDRNELILSIASALRLDELQVRHLVRSISNDATVNFVASLWSDDTPGDEEADFEGAPTEIRAEPPESPESLRA